MINRVMALVRSGYSVCAREVRERVPWRVAVSTVALIVVAAIAFILSLDSGSTVKVTHDQARMYAGILAQVIPVFVLALYVESTAQWSTLLASLGQQRQTHLKLSADVQSNQADNQRVRDEINRIGREYVPVETVRGNERGLLTSLESLTNLAELDLLIRRRSTREGSRAAGISLQLLVCLLGEVFALSSVLAPGTGLIQSATISVALLLYLFGQRLFMWPLTVGGGLGVQLLSLGGLAVLVLVYAAGFARILKITVTG